MALSNREFYQRHALLSAERIEQLLDIEDAARNLSHMANTEEESLGDDMRHLNDVLSVERCE